MKSGLFRIRAGALEKKLAAGLRRLDRDDVMKQIMTRRPNVYSDDRATRMAIRNRLGWVDSASMMKWRVKGIEEFVEGVVKDKLTQIVLMGMGGSSLCPEVFSRMFRKPSTIKSFDVVDSTDPRVLRSVRKKLDFKQTLFIVASKSGGTVETRSQEAYFLRECELAGLKDIGRHFAAITDKGSALQRFARKNKYRKVFVNPSDIGGRYSALSFFGLVPGALAGVDLRALLDTAIDMQSALLDRPAEANPAAALGSLMALAAKDGRDKMTFLASKKLSPFIPWIEQLVAESTGKKKKGVVPIDNEPPLKWESYGRDRMFVIMRMAGERTPVAPAMLKKLEHSKVPMAEMVLRDAHDLGAQLLLWEAATAVAGYHLKINPFDEPNVTESKNNTKALLAKYEKVGRVSMPSPIKSFGKLTVLDATDPSRFRKVDQKSMATMLKRFLSGLKAPAYLSLLSYIKPDPKADQAFVSMRTTVGARRRVATLQGYGPRYLHSIGQLYKGGPANGRFILFVEANRPDIPIPGVPFDFATLIMAQAFGDVQALKKRKLPTLVVLIDGPVGAGLQSFARSLGSALK